MFNLGFDELVSKYVNHRGTAKIVLNDHSSKLFNESRNPIKGINQFVYEFKDDYLDSVVISSPKYTDQQNQLIHRFFMSD